MKAVFLTLLAINVLYLGWRLWIVPSTAPPAFVEAENVPRLVLVGEDPRAVQAAMNPSANQRDPGAAGREPVASGEQTASSGLGASNERPEDVASGSQSASGDPLAPGVRSGSQVASTGQVGSDVSLKRVASASQSPGTAQPGQAAVAGVGATPGEIAISLAERRCASLGPFLNLREATEATAKLNEVGLSPNQRLAESQVWFGHWVHLPSLPNRAAAIEIVEGLRAQGISDIYIEPSGPFVNSISLGVFSDSAHAETRAGQIRKLGVSPQIRDRYRDSSVYWVDFELRPDKVIDPSDYQASPSRVLRLEGRECPEPA